MTSKYMKENDFMCSIISLKARRTETPRTNVNYKVKSSLTQNIFFII